MSIPFKKRGDGRSVLIAAARLEFEEFGFEGTNSNAIARRAGYAPQTFYRHFEDKREIFLAVYEDWSRQEILALETAQSADQIADTLIAHHRTQRVFRQSLRTLTVTDPAIASARAGIRHLQIEAIGQRLQTFAAKPRYDQVTILFVIERICDAIVDGEYATFGIEADQSRIALVKMLQNFELAEPRP
jgi:AcrR family transcriptional regulator